MDFDSASRASPCEGAVGATQVTPACSQVLTQRWRSHTLSSRINHPPELPLASETGECLLLVFESMFGGRSAPRYKRQFATIRTARLIVHAKASRLPRLV
jgi:hypothetical protein